MAQQRHIIGRTILELNTGNLADMCSLQEEVSRLFQQQVVPEIEQLFDRLVRRDEVVRLDQVVVEVGFVDRHFLADDFLRNLLVALDQTLSNALQESSLQNGSVNPSSEVVAPATTRDRSGADWEVLLYFLQYGRLPWWVVDGNWQEWLSRWETVIEGNADWQASVQTLLMTNSTARQRLVKQFPELFRYELVIQLQPTWTSWSTLLQQAKQLMQAFGLDTNTKHQLAQQAWLLLLTEIGIKQPLPVEQWIQNWLMQLIEKMEPVDSLTGTQEPDGEGEASIAPQRLRMVVETFPVSEQSLWLRAIDQSVASPSIEQPHLEAKEADSAFTDPAQAITPEALEQRKSPDQPIDSPHVIHPESGATNRVSSDWALLLDFLQQGRFPESQFSNWQEWVSRWETVIQENTNWQESMRTLLRTNATARQRLVEQFPESFRHQLVLQLQPSWTNWSTLLQQAEQLTWALELDTNTTQHLEQQAWLIMLAEIETEQSFPTERWICHWLMQLIEELEPADSVIGMQEPDGELERTIAPPQRLRLLVEAIPAPERSLWLAALNQRIVPTSTEPIHSDVGTTQTSASASLETDLEQAVTAEKQHETSNQFINSSEATDSEPGLTHRIRSYWVALLDFLQQGRLPEPESSVDWQEWLSRWETMIEGNTDWQASIQTLLMTNLIARQRLVEQFPESFRYQLVIQLQPTWTSWSTLLQQAEQLMQALELDTHTKHQLKQQAWLLLLTEIGIEQPLPVEQWIQNWLIQLIERMELANSATGMQELDQVSGESFQTIVSQRLRMLAETFPAAEWAYWQRVIDLPTTEPTHSDSIAAGELEQHDSETHAIDPSEATDSELDDINRIHPDWATLLSFLQQGRLTGSQSLISWQEWLSRWATVMQETTNWQESIRTLLKTNSAVRQRLVDQFPASFRHQLILQLQPFWFAWYELLNEAQQISQMLNLSNDAVHALEMQAWLLILAEVGTGTEPLPTATWIGNWMAQLIQIPQAATENTPLEQHLQNILTTTPLDESGLWRSSLEQLRLSRSIPPEIDSPAQTTNSLETDANEENRLWEEGDDEGVNQVEAALGRPIAQPRTPPRSHSTLSPEEEVAGLFVTQAGLVLLHPFLRFYLEAVGLVEGDTFRDELAQQTAIYLMHYLATRQTDAPEYELVLPKLLCGWQLDAPVMRGLELADAALAEGETMLQTVINYWDVLKSTSPDGLREGFLQRSGKLTRANDGNWKLQVEQQSIDILLGRLPWGLSMVTLPWMESLLIVEWT